MPVPVANSDSNDTRPSEIYVSTDLDLLLFPRVMAIHSSSIRSSIKNFPMLRYVSPEETMHTALGHMKNMRRW